MLVTLSDDTQQAMRAYRLAVGPGEPAAVVLDPQPGLRRRIGTHAVLNLVGDAHGLLSRLSDFMMTSKRTCAFSVSRNCRKGAAGGDGAAILDQQHVADVVAPGQHIAVERCHS